MTSEPKMVMRSRRCDGDDWHSEAAGALQEELLARPERASLPPFLCPEIYPSDGREEVPRRPDDFEGSVFLKIALAMVDKCQAYVTATEVLQVVLGKHWTLPMEQQWWWQFTYLEHKNVSGNPEVVYAPAPLRDRRYARNFSNRKGGIMSIIKAENAKRCGKRQNSQAAYRVAEADFRVVYLDDRIMRGTEDHRIHLYGTWKEMEPLPGGMASSCRIHLRGNPLALNCNGTTHPCIGARARDRRNTGVFWATLRETGLIFLIQSEMSASTKTLLQIFLYLIEKFTGKVSPA